MNVKTGTFLFFQFLSKIKKIDASPFLFIIFSGFILIFSFPAYAATLPPAPKLATFKLNPAIRLKNSSIQVLAGIKLPNIPIYVNNKLAVPANKYTSWYYEYPITSKTTQIVVSSNLITSVSQLSSATIISLSSITALSVDPPRIFGYRVDSKTKDFLFNIQDPPGVLSYNIYYSNSASGPYILAQTNVSVSGTGITTWRDNGTYTGVHPSKVAMRFYRVEVNRVDTNTPIIIISSPQEGEVIED